MRRIWQDARGCGLFLAEDADISFTLFVTAVECLISMPPTLRHRLVTTGDQTAEDLVTLRPYNIDWWTNQADGPGES